MAPSNTSKNSSNPTSVLLQDMLREKKAQTQHVSKTHDFRDGQKNGLDDRGIQSSPLASRDRPSIQSRRVSGTSVRQVSMPKEMGMKEMEQHLSKINKQNFDLKLEIFHLRQRNEVAETKIGKLQTVEKDNEEMQSINEDMLLELEKRDVAIKEAVNLICELEAKIEEMGEAEMYFGQTPKAPDIASSPLSKNEPQDSSTPPNDYQSPASQAALQEQTKRDLSPRRHQRPKPLVPPMAKSARKLPSFLREHKKSTTVLRSLYSNDGSVGRPVSVFSGDDEDDEEEDGNMNDSPRLSILSASGFSSIYGDGKDSDRITALQTDADSELRQLPSQTARSVSPPENQRETRLQKWIEERNRPTTPTRTSPKPAMTGRFSSIGEVLNDNSGVDHEYLTTDKHSPKRNVREEGSPKETVHNEAGKHQRRPSSPAFGGPMFGGPMLPPTPGTMSTVTIAGNSSTPSIVTEKSLMDGTPFPARGCSAFLHDDRPRSSDSTFIKNVSNALTYEEDLPQKSVTPPRYRVAFDHIDQVRTATRPALTTSATSHVFSGEAYANMQPSRTLSYPSPAGRARRHSGQLSPMSEKSVGSIGERSSSLAREERRSQSSANVTPTKRRTREPQKPFDQDPTTPAADVSDAQPESDPKLGRSSSLRSKINKMSLTSSQPTHQSVASRLFRRSNSQSAQLPRPQSTTPSRPPLSRETTPARHARIPRPTSSYGANPVNGQNPLPNPTFNPTQTHHPEHNHDPNHIYQLSSMLPGGMLTNPISSSSTRYSRQRSERR